MVGAPPKEPRPGPAARLLGWFTAWFGVLVVAAWVLAALAAVHYLPAAGDQESRVVDLAPHGDPADVALQRSIADFGFPLAAQAVVVQRDPHGLSLDAQRRVVQRAVAVDRASSKPDRLAAALPLVNVRGVVPSSHETGTTALTYLLFAPDVSTGDVNALAERFAQQEVNRPDDHLIGVTGSIPARIAEGNRIESALPLVEVVTVALVALIVGLAFRAPGAPLVTLAAAGLAYVITVHVVAWAAMAMQVSMPPELQPVIVVLVLAVVTDYSIFFLAGFRRQLLAGRRRVAAGRLTTGQVAPIVLAAGLTVAAGTAALLVSHLAFLRALGPGLAITVLLAMVVAMTFVPSLLGLLGPLVFWPSMTRNRLPSAAETGTGAEPPASAWRMRVTRAITHRAVAALVVLAGCAALVAAGSGLRDARLGITSIDGLPGDAVAKQAALAAGEGFAPGVVAPTELLLEHAGVARDQGALRALESDLRSRPGVAGVIGPADLPGTPLQSALTGRGGDAARFAVVLDHEPLGGPAVDALQGLEDALPGLLRSHGLAAATVGWSGDTAVALDTVRATEQDMWRVAPVAAGAVLLVLILFLRALVAPALMVLASTLALAAPLGLAVLVFQHLLGRGELTFYVPISAGVLLLALGSDYSVFVVGRIWKQVPVVGMREAVVLEAPRATRAISVAALALALSFGVLAVVPVQPFREFAFVMGVGVLVDAFLVRSIMIPALLALAGRTAGWPGRHAAPPPRPPAAGAGDASVTLPGTAAQGRPAGSRPRR